MTDDKVVMYLIARRDLNMSPGKLAAQVGHGVQYVLADDLKQRIEKIQTSIWKKLWLKLHAMWHSTADDDRNFMSEWAENDHTKIVLMVHSLEELACLEALLGTLAKVVVDAGHTELSAGTRTVLAMKPMPKSLAREYVRHLKSYR